MSVIHVTKANFQQIINSQQPVLLDFWAQWCGPCRMIAPTVELIAEERPDVIVGKVDVDQEPELAMQFQVNSIPSLFVLENGKVIASSLGVQSKDKILSMLP